MVNRDVDSFTYHKIKAKGAAEERALIAEELRLLMLNAQTNTLWMDLAAYRDKLKEPRS